MTDVPPDDRISEGTTLTLSDVRHILESTADDIGFNRQDIEGALKTLTDGDDIGLYVNEGYGEIMAVAFTCILDENDKPMNLYHALIHPDLMKEDGNDH